MPGFAEFEELKKEAAKIEKRRQKKAEKESEGWGSEGKRKAP